MHAPKPASHSVTEEQDDPAVAAFDNAPEEPLDEEERAAFEDAMRRPDPVLSSEELLERIRPKP